LTGLSGFKGFTGMVYGRLDVAQNRVRTFRAFFFSEAHSAGIRILE
jgi:hypothetical protein